MPNCNVHNEIKRFYCKTNDSERILNNPFQFYFNKSNQNFKAYKINNALFINVVTHISIVL